MKKAHSKGYKFCLYKTYFDVGRGITSYFEWLIAYWGLTTGDIYTTFAFAFGYCIFCFFLGWIWIRRGMLDATNEVSNQFNPLYRDIKKKLKIR